MINIDLPEELLQASINKATSLAVEAALDSWELKSAVIKVITAEVANGAVQAAVATALQRVDNEALVNHLAREIQRATTRAVVGILHEGLVDIVCKLRDISNYSEEDKKKREAIRQQLLRQDATPL